MPLLLPVHTPFFPLSTIFIDRPSESGPGESSHPIVACRRCKLLRELLIRTYSQRLTSWRHDVSECCGIFGRKFN